VRLDLVKATGEGVAIATEIRMIDLYTAEASIALEALHLPCNVQLMSLDNQSHKVLMRKENGTKVVISSPSMFIK
jgi:hypothetical protein